MSEADYPPPVDRLLTFGDARNFRKWPDYLQLDLGPEHIPDLIRMVTDEDLYWAESGSLEVWAPTHAWRALGQLRAEAAIEPLIGLLHRIDDDQDDWVDEELHKVFAMIGPAAIPALTTYLADSSHGLYARINAAKALASIAEAHPDIRAECIAILARQLERFEQNDPTLNAFLIDPLLDLEAIESAPVMERAFAGDYVDVSAVGDWEDVQVELGLKEARESPRPNYLLESMRRSVGGSPPAGFKSTVTQPRHSAQRAGQKAKVKRKQAEKSRKKNRKKRR